MGPLTRLLRRLASPDDRARFDEQPHEFGRLRLLARVTLRFGWVYLALLVFSLVLTIGAGMDIYHRTEVPEFCGSCHEMNAKLASWRSSRHESVKCVECHARGGFGGWIVAKIDGTRQLLRHFSAESIEDIRADGEARDITNENCRRCHSGAVRLEERRGLVISHRRHLEIGTNCVSCHARSFAHPDATDLGTVPGKRIIDSGLCFACHDGATVVGTQIAFDWRKEESCASCHPDSLLAEEHGAGHTCLECHGEPAAGEHFPVPASGNAPLCTECHDPPTDLVSTHTPFAEGKCEKCHEVMSPARLYGTSSVPTTALCTGCHEEIGTLVTATESSERSAFADGETDLHREHADYIGDEEAWCLSCHDSHGSSATRGLVRLRTEDDEDAVPGEFDAGPTGGTCLGSCHGEDELEYERGSDQGV